MIPVCQIRRIPFLFLMLITTVGSNSAIGDPEDFVPKVHEIESGLLVSAPARSPGTIEYRFIGDLARASMFSGMRLSLVGDSRRVDDFLFLFHGDKPSYYDPPMESVRSAVSVSGEMWKLHQALSKQGEGLLIVQPKCSEVDWHSLFKNSNSDFRAMNLVLEIQAIYVALSQRVPGEGRLHLHSFSGAGRVDRAIHRAILENDASLKNLREAPLASWTASDAMVNNSFSAEEKLENKSVMAVSWALFLKERPSLPVTIVYDKTAEYPYMQGINLDVIRFHQDLRDHGQIRVGPSVEIIQQGGVYSTSIVDPVAVAEQLRSLEKSDGVLRVKSADGHLESFLEKIAECYIEHRSMRAKP